MGVHNGDEGDEAMKDNNVNVVQQPRIFDKSFTAITVVLLMKTTYPPVKKPLETWKHLAQTELLMLNCYHFLTIALISRFSTASDRY